jgi:ABC-type phosphate transport system substrate-binding protein
MAPKGSSVIQAMLKRLAEEVQQKQNEAKVSIDAAGRPKARSAAV